MEFISEASSPNPGLVADPQIPENVGLPKTIFWDAATFGTISKDVYAIFTGALFIYKDPEIHTGTEMRSDHADVKKMLELKKIKL